ncbi:MAG: DNA methyltransferase, partial [Actinomycetota bacterium]
MATTPTNSALGALREAATSFDVVSLGSRRTNSPHDFYRYPARFPPKFAAAAVQAFTRPGDLVLDPFVGGGTTLVEAVRLGRRAVGADINPIAVFVSR